jgi:hypothetical protein
MPLRSTLFPIMLSPEELCVEWTFYQTEGSISDPWGVGQFSNLRPNLLATPFPS